MDNTEINQKEKDDLKRLLKRAEDALFSLIAAKSELTFDKEGNETAVMTTTPETYEEAQLTKKSIAEALNPKTRKTMRAKGQKRMGRVELKLSYVVDLDDQAMIDKALEALADGAELAVRYRKRSDAIKIVEDPAAKEEDILQFLLEDERIEFTLDGPERVDAPVDYSQAA